MTISSVEQILDSAIALLMYGSGGWLSYSLVAFVVTRPKASVYRGADKVTTVSKEIVSTSSEGIISIEVMPEVTTETPTETVSVVQAVEVSKITCQPVNWKKWKVNELRQTNITRVCGVRVSLIGSSRKLTKPDLIAQYEQNLKRMTYEQPGSVLQSEKVA